MTREPEAWPAPAHRRCPQSVNGGHWWLQLPLMRRGWRPWRRVRECAYCGERQELGR